MRKIFIAIFAALCIAMTTDEVIRKENNTYIVNTTSLATDVEGFHGNTPVEIYIENDTIRRVVALQNDETPRFFKLVEDSLLPRFTGIAAKAMESEEVDGVTGATYSSNAIRENVRRGAKYYTEHKE